MRGESVPQIVQDSGKIGAVTEGVLAEEARGICSTGYGKCRSRRNSKLVTKGVFPKERRYTALDVASVNEILGGSKYYTGLLVVASY